MREYVQSMTQSFLARYPPFLPENLLLDLSEMCRAGLELLGEVGCRCGRFLPGT